MENDEEQHLASFRMLFILTEALGVLCVVLVGTWIMFFRGGFAWRSDPFHEVYLHPFLTVLGLVFMYANGALMYRGFRSVKKKTLKTIHSLILLGSMILTVVGTMAIFDYQSAIGVDKMYSLHSWMGVAVIILFTCQWVAGFWTFFYPGLSPPTRASYLPVHHIYGLLIFGGSVTCSLLGFTEKAIYVLNGRSPENPPYTSLPMEGILINIIGLLLFIFACLVIYLTANPHFRRQIPEEQPLLSFGSNNLAPEIPFLAPTICYHTLDEPPLTANFFNQMPEEDSLVTDHFRRRNSESSLMKHLLSV